MLESILQKLITERAARSGWIGYKWASPAQRGVLDYIYFKSGYTVIIEYKQRGKTPSKLQLKCMERLRLRSIPHYVIDRVQVGYDFFAHLDRQIDKHGPLTPPEGFTWPRI